MISGTTFLSQPPPFFFPDSLLSFSFRPEFSFTWRYLITTGYYSIKDEFPSNYNSFGDSFKGWSYLDATYFSFITLTTVGFGDIVVGETDKFDYIIAQSMAIYYRRHIV
jgi:hypothetical protein